MFLLELICFFNREDGRYHMDHLGNTIALQCSSDRAVGVTQIVIATIYTLQYGNNLSRKKTISNIMLC